VCVAVRTKPFSDIGSTAISHELWQRSTYEKIHLQVAPPTPVELQELRDSIVNATALSGVTFLKKLWDELEYRLDVCRITRGSHIERL
jgi:hypothetical protein